MNRKFIRRFVWLAALGLALSPRPAFSQTTAFTYQGKLSNNGVPANGLYDLRFKLFVDPLGDTQTGAAVLTNGVPVTNGLFTVTVAFGASPFNGSNYWLEVDVKTNDAPAYEDLSPLQGLTAAPYALFAATAGNVAGGYINTASGIGAAVAGGYGNTASGGFATAAGFGNTASGTGSFAAGVDAQAENDGSFVWADDSGQTFTSTADNQFCVRASGGVLLEAQVQVGIGGSDYRQLALGGGNSTGFLYGSFPKWQDGVHLGYNYYADASGNDVIPNSGGGTSRISAQYGQVELAVGNVNTAPTVNRLIANSSGVTVTGTFNQSSDRNAKQDFAPVSPSRILDQVAQLPLSEWSYKEDPKTRHVGPVAQDFYSIFNIGTDDKHIAPIDEGGVALAAIQGLNQKLEARTRELEVQSRRLGEENAELKARLEKLERLIPKPERN